VITVGVSELSLVYRNRRKKRPRQHRQGVLRGLQEWSTPDGVVPAGSKVSCKYYNMEKGMLCKTTV